MVGGNGGGHADFLFIFGKIEMARRRRKRAAERAEVIAPIRKDQGR